MLPESERDTMAMQYIMVERGTHHVGNSFYWNYSADEKSISFNHAQKPEFNFSAAGNFIGKTVMVYLEGASSEFIGIPKAPKNAFRKAFWEIGIKGRDRFQCVSTTEIAKVVEELFDEYIDSKNLWQDQIPGTCWFEESYAEFKDENENLIGAIKFSRDWYKNNQRWQVVKIYYTVQSLDLAKKMIEKIEVFRNA